MASTQSMFHKFLVKKQIEELAREWAGEGAEPQAVEVAVNQAMKVFEALLNENSKNKILRFMEANFDYVQKIRDEEFEELCTLELDSSFNTPSGTPQLSPRDGSNASVGSGPTPGTIVAVHGGTEAFVAKSVGATPLAIPTGKAAPVAKTVGATPAAIPKGKAAPDAKSVGTIPVAPKSRSRSAHSRGSGANAPVAKATGIAPTAVPPLAIPKTQGGPLGGDNARNHIEAAREAGLESLAANTEAARQEEARKKELEAARQEEARLANIEAAHQKEARKKELEAACQEEARLANIEAARQKEEEEEAHKKELEAARQEEARLANIEAARQEEARKKELEAARQEEARLANIEAARQKEEEARKKELEAARQEEEARLAAVALEAARQEDDTRLAAEALEAARQEEEARLAAEALEAARQEEARLDTEAHETAPPNDNAGAGDGVNLSGRRGDGSAFAGPWATGSAEYHAARRALQGTTQNPRSEVVRNNLVNTATVAGKKLSLKTEKQKLKRVYDDGCSVQNIKFAMQRALVIEKMNESNESTIDSKIMAHNKRQATIERKRRLEQMSEEELERMDQLMTSRSNSSSGSR